MLFIREFKMVEIYPSGLRVTTIHRGRFYKVNSDIKKYKALCEKSGLEYTLFKNGMVVYR